MNHLPNENISTGNAFADMQRPHVSIISILQPLISDHFEANRNYFPNTDMTIDRCGPGLFIQQTGLKIDST